MKAKDELHAFVKYVEATDDNSFESLLRAFAQKDFDIIFAIGITQREAIQKVAAQFPQKRFAMVDAEVNAPNVRSLMFEEQQGSYLVGAAAALASQSGQLGFIGGMDIPLIRRFQMGFEAGAKKINPKVKVMSNYIGMTGDAWNDPAKGKELAVTQYDRARMLSLRWPGLRTPEFLMPWRKRGSLRSAWTPTKTGSNPASF